MNRKCDILNFSLTVMWIFIKTTAFHCNIWLFTILFIYIHRLLCHNELTRGYGGWWFEENGKWFWIVAGSSISHTHTPTSHTRTHVHAHSHTHNGPRQAFLRLSGVNLFLSWGPDKRPQGVVIIASLPLPLPTNMPIPACMFGLYIRQ